MGANGQLLLILGGVAAIVVALVWRYLARRHEEGRLEARLELTNDPADRARAGNELVELGLRRASQPLLRAMAREPDNRVCMSVALAVARRQWEPGGSQRVTALREWAKQEFDYQGQPVAEFGPAVTRLADMGGPRPPEQHNAQPAANGSNGNGSSAANGSNGNGNGAGVVNGARPAVPEPVAAAASSAPASPSTPPFAPSAPTGPPTIAPAAPDAPNPTAPPATEWHAQPLPVPPAAPPADPAPAPAQNGTEDPADRAIRWVAPQPSERTGS